jgi:hypothetical protein
MTRHGHRDVLGREAEHTADRCLRGAVELLSEYAVAQGKPAAIEVHGKAREDTIERADAAAS